MKGGSVKKTTKAQQRFSKKQEFSFIAVKKKIKININHGFQKSCSSLSHKTLGVSLVERKNTRQNISTTKRNITTSERIIATAERNIATAKRIIATAERNIATAERIIATAERNIATAERIITTAERIIVCRFSIIATQFRNLATAKKENRTPNSRLLQWLGLGIIWKILCFFQSYFYICER